MMSTDEYRDLCERIDALSGRTDGRFGEVDVQLERIETTLRAEIRANGESVRRDVEETIRRCMDILYEKFHADVQRIFEGYDHQGTVLDDHEHRIQALEHPRLSFEG
jgi:hypothetical protein